MTGPERGKPPRGKRRSKAPVAGGEPEEALFQRTMAGVRPLKKKRSLTLKSPAAATAVAAKPVAGPQAARSPAPPPAQLMPFDLVERESTTEPWAG